MEQGGVDVLLSTAYLLEQGWIDDMSIVQKLFWLFPKIKKKLVDVSYFDATMLMLDEMEQQIEKYNKKSNKERLYLLKMETILSELFALGICALFILWKAHILYRENWEENNRKSKDSAGSIKRHAHRTLACKKRNSSNNLDAFKERGVAYLGIAHFYPNRCVFCVPVSRVWSFTFKLA